MCVQREGRSVLGRENVEGGGCTGEDGESPLNHSYSGTGGGAWVNRRVLCTRQLLGLTAKGPWLALSEPIPSQAV